MKRDIQLVNIKLHENTLIDFSEGSLFAFMGKNGSGKSTIIQCLESIAMAQNTMKEPVKRGKEAGKVIRHGQTRDGLDITIEWEVTNEGQNSFRASYFDRQGNPKLVTDPKMIRELMGSYFNLSVNDAFEMMKYAEGRRKFIQDYIYASLTQTDRVRLAELDLQITDKKNKASENNLFHQRTAKRKELDANRLLLGTQSMTPAEEKEATLVAKYEGHLARLVEQNQSFNDLYLQKVEMIAIHNEMMDSQEKLEEYNKKWEGRQNVETPLSFTRKIIEELAERIENMDKSLEEKEELEKRIALGKEKIAEAKRCDQKQKSRNETLLEIQGLENYITDLEASITKTKEARQEIIRNSPLPGGLAFDEDTISLNGFEFNETTLSETEARIALLDLLCSISTADFITIGDWSLYDAASRKKILEIAKKKNRMVFGQMVTEDNEITCKTIIVE